MFMGQKEMVGNPLKTKMNTVGRMFGLNAPNDLKEVMNEVNTIYGLNKPGVNFEKNVLEIGGRIQKASAAGDAAAMRTGISNLSTAMNMTSWGDMKTAGIANKLAGSAAGRWTMSKGIGLAAKIGTKAFAASNLIGWGMLAGDVIWGAGKAVVNSVVNGTKALTEDWRRGSFMSTGGLPNFVGSTYRQRSLAAMQQTGMNLQSVLGNESSYF
jgi:hypothetical protein